MFMEAVPGRMAPRDKRARRQARQVPTSRDFPSQGSADIRQYRAVNSLSRMRHSSGTLAFDRHTPTSHLIRTCCAAAHPTAMNLGHRTPANSQRAMIRSFPPSPFRPVRARARRAAPGPRCCPMNLGLSAAVTSCASRWVSGTQHRRGAGPGPGHPGRRRPWPRSAGRKLDGRAAYLYARASPSRPRRPPQRAIVATR